MTLSDYETDGIPTALRRHTETRFGERQINVHISFNVDRVLTYRTTNISNVLTWMTIIHTFYKKTLRRTYLKTMTFFKVQQDTIYRKMG